MPKKKKVIDGKYKSIKIKWVVYEDVKHNKEKTGVNIGFFIEQAIEEKLCKEKI